MRSDGPRRAGLEPDQIDIVSTHATGTSSGDSQECAALRSVFGSAATRGSTTPRATSDTPWVRPGALELAGNLASFRDRVVHPTINVDELDPDCELPGLVLNEPQEMPACRLHPEQFVWHARHQLGRHHWPRLTDHDTVFAVASPSASVTSALTRHPMSRSGAIESMTPAEIREEILDILEDISPDEDLDDLDDDKPFRDQLELDSMDFLDIVMELRKRHRVQIPEEEYGNLASMCSTVTYLEPKMRDIVKS